MKLLKTLLVLAGAASLSACVTFPTMESEKVKVLWDDTYALRGCEHKGTVLGSQGHFYDYWLHADRDMVWGTLNEMRIKAHEKGADTIYLFRPFGFLGSVTMMANAYDCSGKLTQTSEMVEAEVQLPLDPIVAEQPAQ